MKTLELLAPAGSPEALDAAIGEGADAVYLGLKDFNARLRSANFTYGQFESALRTLRRMGKKVYVTVNTVFEQREADRMYQFLKYLADQGPDAIIVQDFGVAAMARSEFPSLRLHASTQMNIASARAANALSRHGISRVVLARELSLEELRSVKSETNLELEVFVHGALCISVSGLCLFSSFLGGKSANRGMCTQACRRLYHRSEGESGYYFSPNDLQLLERVPDLYSTGIKALKIEGRMKSASYVGAVVSAYRLVADACMNGDNDEIQRSIEQGQEILRNDFARAKTQYLFGGGAEMKHGLTRISADEEETNHRITRINANEDEDDCEGFTTEHYKNKIDWLNPEQDGGTGINLGFILKVKGSLNEKRILVKPPKGIRLSAGDSVRIHSGDDSGRVSHKLMFAEKAAYGSGISADSFWISAPEHSDGQPFFEIKQGDSVYLIQTKEMRKRYAPIITDVSGGRGPGREKAPAAQLARREEVKGKDDYSSEISGANKGNLSAKFSAQRFPEGLYVAVSRPEDLYIVQSSRPQKVMLLLSRKNAEYLLSENKQPLPFKPSEIILILDPFFPQSVAGYENEVIAKEIRLLYEEGYYQYMVNNPGHFSMFRELDRVKLIAGPWLYMFNSWALSFVASSFTAGKQSIDGFVSPLENNRQNLERTLGIPSRGENMNKKKRHIAAKFSAHGKNTRLNSLQSKFFITVFAWPPLFNIRENLKPVLDFNSFADNKDEAFTLFTDDEGSRVNPVKYFSIIDKIPFLKEAGFGRFIIDLSGAAGCKQALKKSEYRDLMRAINENAPLPNSSRFNWKDGFLSS